MESKRRDFVCAALLAVIVGHLSLSHATLPPWWSLGLQDCAASFTECNNCADTQVLTEEQQELCSDNGETELVRAISRGTLECIRLCQNQFSDSQWNCTTFKGNYLFGSFIENATRETAILNAYLSAGAAHGIASACHDNIIDGCACIAGPTIREDEITYLQSCGDNVDFAISFLKQFYGLEESTCERDLVDKWNNELGYDAVNNRSTYCRCTGLSGSCVVQTCYEKAPSIEDIGSKLQPRYAGSQKVYGYNATLYLAVDDERRPIANFPCHINDTPNLCDPEPERGILGTSGRKCNPLSSGPDSCGILCCDGYEQRIREIQREKCKFVWCCRIECTKLETVEITEYLCL